MADLEQKRSLERLRHYTNKKGIDGIEKEKIIQTGDRGRVFAERASRPVLSKIEAETKYGIKQGHGRHYIEFDAFEDEFMEVENKLTQSVEITIEKDIHLEGRHPKYFRRTQ